MFGSSKPVVFEPYGRRRSGWRMPRWMVLLLTGVIVGAGGVVLVQERYLPPRLSASASTALRQAFDQADAGRQRLQGELAEATRKLDGAVADNKRLTDQLSASRASVDALRDDAAAVVAALPPDPRGGAVEIRAARFATKPGALSYEVVLTREHAASGRPMPGVLQLVVAGESARGSDTTLNLKPVALAMGGHEIARGSLPLPDGFKPRQATVQVLDRAAGKLLGMRVWLVK